MPDPDISLAGGTINAFRWDGRRLEWLDQDRGPALTGERGDVEVEVSLFRAGTRLLCGEVKVATVLTGDATKRQYQRLNTLGEPDDPVHIDSALWRAIPIGSLVEAAVEGIQDFAAKAFEQIGDEYLGEVARSERPSRQRGPRPSLTPELLARVVAPAFAAGGRRSVEAVRQALQEAGYQGSGPDGGVTVDQARKAVKKAREAHLIPPARRRGGRAR